MVSLYQPTKIKTFNSSFAEYPVLEKLVKNTDAAGRLSLCQHMEHPARFELANTEVAVPCLTTWLRVHSQA